MQENQNEFKVGDWVVGEDICRKSKKSTTISKLKEMRKPSQFAWPYILENGSYCAKIKKWEPKEGDWCWFRNNMDEIHSLAKYEAGNIYDAESAIKSVQIGPHGNSYWDVCKPFIGELPYES